MPKMFYSSEACHANASERRTGLANSVLHLIQDTIPLPITAGVPKATLVANEATYDGYAPITIANFTLPGLAPGDGWMVNQPLVQFGYVDGMAHVHNVIVGAFLLDAGGTVRVLVALLPGEELPFAVNGDVWPLTYAILFPTGF
jgi:hypothetical protein